MRSGQAQSNRMNVQTAAAMEIVRNRLMVAVFLFLGIFVLLSARMVALGISGGERVEGGLGAIPFYEAARADILDRGGTVLATNLEISSLYADPTRVLDAREAIAKLSLVFSDLNEGELLARLTSAKKFVWVKRKLTQTNFLGGERVEGGLGVIPFYEAAHADILDRGGSA